jgi:hypothetical protein
VLVDERPWSHLFPVEGGLILSPAESEVVDFNSNSIAGDRVLRMDVFHGGTWGKVPLLVRMGYDFGVAAVRGGWPDGLDVMVNARSDRTGSTERYTLETSGWVIHKPPCAGNCRYGAGDMGEIQQVGSRLLVLFRGNVGQPHFQVLRGAALSPRLTPATAKCSTTSPEAPRVLVWPSIFGGTRDDTVISFGDSCAGGQRIEVWKSGSATSTVTRIPEPAGSKPASTEGQIVAGVNHDAWLLAGRVFHYDGEWKEIATPPGTSFYGGTVARDGSLWILDQKTIWKRVGETWSEVSLPADFKPEEVELATSEGEVWVLGDGLLLRQKHEGETPISTLPPRNEQGERVTHRKVIRPGSVHCRQNLVVLHAFTKVTPEDYDFPLTRKALKGHTELGNVRFAITSDSGKKYLTAMTPSFESGKKIVALIEKGIPGAKPQLICAEPEIVGELLFDLQTGEIERR